ncbi:MAG: hypothetical protein ACK5T6_17915, partial [Pirellula sp.]
EAIRMLPLSIRGVAIASAACRVLTTPGCVRSLASIETMPIEKLLDLPIVLHWNIHSGETIHLDESWRCS